MLIAHYPFIDGLRDISSSQNHLSYQNNAGNLGANDVGKLGQCQERTTYNTTDYYRSDRKINLTGDFTMMAWVKVTQVHPGTANGVVTNHNHSNNSGAGITIKDVSSTDFRISCNTGTGTSRTFHTYYGTTNIKDKWSHLVVRYEGDQLTLWVNGEIERTVTYNMYSPDDWLEIFNWSTNHTSSSNYRPVCQVNDVRVYNHACTTKEIKEILKAKVLHYTFNQSPDENLMPPLTKMLVTGTLISSEANLIEFNKTSTNWTAGLGVNTPERPITEPGKTYTLDYEIYCDVDGVSDVIVDLNNTRVDGGANPHGNDNRDETIGDTRIFAESRTWTRHTVSWRVSATGGQYYDYTKFAAGTTIGVRRVRNVMMYEGLPKDRPAFTPANTSQGVWTDVCGLYHGSSAQSPVWNQVDPITGSGCVEFNNSVVRNDRIDTPTTYRNPQESFTLSFWERWRDIGDRDMTYCNTGTSKDWDAAGGGFCFGHGWGSSIYGGVNGERFTAKAFGGTAGVWGLATFTFDSETGAIRYYRDGEFKWELPGTPRLVGNSAHDRLTIGKDDYRGGNFGGALDDFRLYASVLSDDDIMGLYKKRANFDRDGRATVGEFRQSTNVVATVQDELDGRNSFKYASTYTQSNCSVARGEGMYHVVRPANIGRPTKGNTMWGGVKLLGLKDLFADDMPKSGDEFRVVFEYKGQSSNTPDSPYFSPLVGWSTAGGLKNVCSRTDIKPFVAGVVHDEWQTAVYDFVVNQDPWITATKTENKFVTGIDYFCMDGFKFGWGYVNDTGSLGTDVFIKNIKIVRKDAKMFGVERDGILSAFDVSEVGVVDGLKGYWNFTRNSLDDLSDNTNNVTLDGATLSNGITVGSSARAIYTGTKDFDFMKADASIPFTILCHFHSNTADQPNEAPILGKSGYHAGLMSHGDRIVARFRSGTTWKQVQDTNPIAERDYVAAVTYDGTTTSLYVDGEFVASMDEPLDYPYSGDFISGFKHASSYCFDGIIYESKLFQRALSAKEVAIEQKRIVNKRIQINRNGTTYLTELNEGH